MENVWEAPVLPTFISVTAGGVPAAAPLMTSPVPVISEDETIAETSLSYSAQLPAYPSVHPLSAPTSPSSLGGISSPHTLSSHCSPLPLSSPPSYSDPISSPLSGPIPPLLIAVCLNNSDAVR